MLGVDVERAANASRPFAFLLNGGPGQISKITGMIMGRRWVFFWM